MHIARPGPGVAHGCSPHPPWSRAPKSRTVLTGLLAVLPATGLTPRPVQPQTGLQLAGVPAINFDFFDAPSLLGDWRLDVFAGSQRQIATPYYGMGNDAPYDPGRVNDADPYYYRFGRTLRSALVNLQRPIADTPLRLLVGGGLLYGSLDAVPEGTGTTLVAEEIADGIRPGVEGWINYVRAGLIWDTRDRETAPGTGTWSDLLVQRVDRALGSEVSYTRWTLTDRRYWRLGPLVVANRLLLQGVSRDVPLADLHRLQTSFRDQEGLGGARSVRGLLRNRYAGRGMFLWNTEIRWRAVEFGLWRRSFHLALSGFFDAPSLLGDWRLDVFAGSQRQIATPYYGMGNDAPYDPG
ncbi:MAG: hypothetical protein P8188_10060, partial [Gemmatimonadota bacterium]